MALPEARSFTVFSKQINLGSAGQGSKIAISSENGAVYFYKTEANSAFHIFENINFMGNSADQHAKVFIGPDKGILFA